MPDPRYLDGSATVSIEGEEAGKFGVFNKALGGFEENSVEGTITVLAPAGTTCECHWTAGWELLTVTEVPIG
jgi:hypothetical protein